MIQIYNPPRWRSAQYLSRALQDLGLPAEVVDRRVDRAEPVVNWGFSNRNGTLVLNSQIVGNKLHELQKLANANIETVPFVEGNHEDAGWMPRVIRHRAGLDLRKWDAMQEGRRRTLGFIPDFWVQKLDIAHEFRLHIFCGKSIRAGMKIPNETANREPHLWIRSLKTGWKIDYGTVCQEMLDRIKGIRQLAKDAVEVLEYDFGAVDIGTTRDGQKLVLEVNSAPGLDNNNTARIYAQHIMQAINRIA